MTETNITTQILNNSPAPNPFLEENGAMPHPHIHTDKNTYPWIDDVFIWKADVDSIKPLIKAYYDRTTHFSGYMPLIFPDHSDYGYLFFLTNENYQYALPKIENTGGISVGVSMLLPFTYAVYSGADYAFSLDINSGVPFAFVPVFSALLMMAPTRLHFLSLITGRPVPEGFDVDQMGQLSINEQLFNLQSLSDQDPDYSNAILNALNYTVINEAPYDYQNQITWAVEYFFSKFNESHTISVLSQEHHGIGGPLSSEEAYRLTRQMVLSGKMTGIVGHIANGGFPKIMEISGQTGKKIRIINISNAPSWIYSSSKKSNSADIYNYFLELSRIEDPDNVQVVSADYLPHVNITTLREYLERSMPLNLPPEQAIEVYEKFLTMNMETSRLRRYNYGGINHIPFALRNLESRLEDEMSDLIHEVANVVGEEYLTTSELHERMYFASKQYRALTNEEIKILLANLVHLGVIKRDSFEFATPVTNPVVQNLISALDSISSSSQRITNFQDVSEQSVDNSNYEEWIKALSAEVSRASHTTQDKVTTAFYPLSGYSLPDVVATFPNAEVYILATDDRFLHAEYLKQYQDAVEYEVQGVQEQQQLLREGSLSGWKPEGFVENIYQIWHNTENAGALPLILGRMRAAYPEIVFHRAISWQATIPSTSPFIDGQFYPKHGMLEFSLRPGEPSKTMFFIDTHISLTRKNIIAIGDNKPLDISNVDGVLIKGSQGVLSYNERAIEYLTTPLMKNGGVLIEGITETLPDWELSGFYADGESETSTFPLSYRNGMQVTRFTPQTKANNQSQNLSNGPKELIGLLRDLSAGRHIITNFVDVTRTTYDSSHIREWTRGVEKLSRRIMSNQPTQVLYPFSGYDLSSAVATFPSASVYVMVSANPFMPEAFRQDEKTFEYTVKPREYGSELGNVSHGSEVWEDTKYKGVLSLMIGDLKSAYPNAIIKKAEVFKGKTNSLEVKTPVQANITPMHGTLTFSLGPDEPDKTVIYIHSYVHGANEDILTINGAPLNIRFIDGVMIKGAQGTLVGKQSAFEYLTESLRNNGGWLVEGADEQAIRGEFELSPTTNHGTEYVDFPYSYRSGMLFTRFDASPSEQLPQNIDKAQPVITGVIIENEDEDEGSTTKRNRRTNLDNTTNAVTTTDSITVPVSLGNTTGVVNQAIQTPLIRK